MNISFNRYDKTLTIDELIFNECHVAANTDFTLYHSDLYNNPDIFLTAQAVYVLKRIFDNHDELNVKVI